MFRQYQYDVFTEPPTTLPENVTADRWSQPQSQPQNNFVAKAKGIALAIITAGIFYTSFVGATSTPANAGVSVDANRIRFQKKFASQIQSFFWGEFTPPAATLTPVIAPCSEYPTQFYAKKYLIEALEASDGQSPQGPIVIPQQFGGGGLGKSLRIKFTKPAVALIPSFFWGEFTPAATTATDWIQPQNQPVRVKIGLAAAEQQYSFFGKPTQVEYLAVTDLTAQPVLQRSGLHASQQQYYFAPAQQETVLVSSYVQPQSQPYSCKRTLLTAQQQATFWNTSTSAEGVESASWYPTYPQPWAAKLYLATANQQYQTEPLSEQAESVLVSSWFQNTQQPYPYKRALLEAIDASAGQAVMGQPPSPEVVEAASWYPTYPQPWSAKLYLSAANQQYFFFGRQIAQEYLVGNLPISQPQYKVRNTAVYEPAANWVFTPFAPSMDWLQPQSQPTPAKQSLLATNQQAAFWNVSTPPETVFVSSWFQNTQQPYPYKKAVLTAAQQATFWNTSTAPETIFESSWQGVQSLQALLRKVQQPNAVIFVGDQGQPSVILPDQRLVKYNRAVYESASSFIFTPSAVFTNWLPSYPDRVESKKYLLTSNQQYCFAPLSEQQEVVEVSSWTQPQQDQTRAKAYLQTAQQQAFFWQPQTPGDFTFLLHWEPIYPQPFPAKRYLASANQQYYFAPLSEQTETIFVSEWVQPQNQPYPYKPYRPAAIYPAAFWNTSTSPETVFVSSYVQPQTQPYPARPILGTGSQQFLFEPLSEQTESILVSSWAQPQSQPYPYTKALATSQQQAAFWNTSTQPETVLVTSYVQPQSQPYPYRRALLAGEQLTFVWEEATSEEVSIDWAQPQSQPYSYKKAELTANQQAAFWNTSTTPETTTADKWQPVYPQPFPAKRYLSAANQQAFIWQPQTPGDFTFLLHWEPTYPQPFPTKLYLQTANVPSFFWNTSTQPENVLVSSWVQPQSQPYPYKPYRPAALYPSTFYDPSFAPENAQVSSWAQPESQPQARIFTRAVYEPAVSWSTNTPQQVILDWLGATEQPTAKVQNRVQTDLVFVPPTVEGWQQQVTQPSRKQAPKQYEAIFWSTFTPQAVVLTDNWQPQYPERIYTKPYELTANQQAIFWNTSTTPETVECSSWMQPVSQPVVKNYIATAEQQYIFWQPLTPIAVVFDWAPIYPDQIAAKKYLTANQQAVDWNTSTSPETVFVSSYVQPQPDQTKSRKYLLTAAQQATFWSTFTPPVLTLADNWQPVYPERIYTKPSLLTAAQQAAFWNTSTSPETVFVTSWIQPISEPYPAAKALSTADQQASAWSTFTPPPPIVPDFGWYVPAIQPYPQPRFHEALQQSTINSNLPLPNPVTQFVQGTGTVTEVIVTQGSITNTISGQGSIDQ